MTNNSNRDDGLDNLLALNGEHIAQEAGYYVKIEAWEVERTKQIPQGIRYSLTLHDQYGVRVLGFDNAHAIKPPKKYGKKPSEFDHEHRHRSDKGIPYTYINAHKLTSDFFVKVDDYIQKHLRGEQP